MANILVVEDEDFLRDILTQRLQKANHTVFGAANGEIAREILQKQNDINLVISDAQMPKMTGIELLEWIKSNKPLPFILVTGFTNLLETQTAYELGANEFLSKPFKGEELMAAVDKLLSKQSTPTASPAPQSIALDQQFCKVSIDEFVSRYQIDFDVYVRLSGEKYVQIGHNGDLIPADHLRAYRTKGIRFLYIRKDEFGKFVGYNPQGDTGQPSSASIPQDKVRALINTAQKALLEQTYLQGVNETSFAESADLTKCTLTLLCENPKAFNLLQTLNQHHPSIFAHSFGTSVYSVLIARALGFGSTQLFFKLSMAALLHDVGKTKIAPEILGRPYNQLSALEKEIINKHAEESRDILRTIETLPSDIFQIVFEHHEDGRGGGPQKLLHDQMHPLSKILFTANQFANLALPSGTAPGMSPAEALLELEKLYGNSMQKPAIEALKQVFGVAPRK